MDLLDMGLQYSIEKPLNEIWNDVIIETEIAIRTTLLLTNLITT
jgi:hypothetical protein